MNSCFWKETFLVRQRPKTLDGIIGNDHIINVLKTYLKSNQLTNFIFIGDTGIGKSTCCDLLVREYLGEKIHEYGRLDVYGTLYRGKDVIVEQSSVSKTLGKVTKTSKSNSSNAQMNVTSFIRRYDDMEDKQKVVVFHDLDSSKINDNTQLALRRVMEEHSDTYYIILCENLSKIIEPIQSRSILLHFNNPTTKQLYLYATQIVKREQLGDKITTDMLKNICITSNQNIRKMLIYMWMLSYINIENDRQFQMLFGVTSVRLMTMIVIYCYKKDIYSALKITKYMIDEGFNLEDMVQSFIKILDFCKVSDEFRQLFITRIGECIVNNAKYQSDKHLYVLITELCV